MICPRCSGELRPFIDHAHRHICDDPWIYTAPGTAGGPKRAVRIEYVSTGFLPVAVPVDIGNASSDSIVGQPSIGVSRAS
jgi:hypothetical protein